MTTTYWILGDQLTLNFTTEFRPADGPILMIESHRRARQLPYHKQKLIFLWSAMRHFAKELRGLGYTVEYYTSQPNFADPLGQHIAQYQPNLIRLMASAEYGGSQKLARLVERPGVAVEIVPNTMFISDQAEFAEWAIGKKSLVMETFYRKMRRQTGLLMNGKEPVGGQWNYDKLNRNRPPKGHRFPDLPSYPPTALTQAVMVEVAQEFPNHFGTLDKFNWPVTRQKARDFFEDFLDQRLDMFGPYEDAVVRGERSLYHSLISTLLNVGLLDPLELCQQAELRYQHGQARLNSVEGFIRQIIGWREFVYQIYQWQMPGYLTQNFFEADLPLPDFYWTTETDMRCVRDAIETLRDYGVNHHIQRLMITGNFALIAGINPQAVNEWYWLAYTDAYEWVVSPNVLGMTLYADGGVLATKPYAASANYINKMSNCCASCAYNPKKSVGVGACPFNALYWDFLARNADTLSQNPRMNLIMAGLRKRDTVQMAELRQEAQRIRDKLRVGARV